MDIERFQKQLAFILEADKVKSILRQTHLTGYLRRENDAEHAWHMALMVYLLQEYANTEFDVAKAMMMALIHDIVEIDAGDTYAYDEKAKKSQKERELLIGYLASCPNIRCSICEDYSKNLRQAFLRRLVLCGLWIISSLCC